MRTISTIVIVAIWCICAAGAAQAHAMLDRANPPVGSTSKTAPRAVVLTFTEALEPAFSSAEVRNADGQRVDSGKAHVNSTELRVAVKPLPPGSYKVFWHVLSVDTHRTEGSFSFSVGQ